MGVVLLLGETEAEHAQGVAVSRLLKIGEVISLSGQTLIEGTRVCKSGS